MKIHACLMTQNELHELRDNVELLLPHVDSVNIVDGGSADQTILYMRNWAKQEPKIRFFVHPWKDNFPAQRNNYLARAREIAEPGDWVFAADPDEILDPRAAECLRDLAHLGDATGHNLIGFRCRSVSLRGRERVWESEDNYWKRLLIRYDPNFSYIALGEGQVHEAYAGIPHLILDTGNHPSCPETFWYEHRKQDQGTTPKGMRNYVCGGGGPNLGSSNPRWVELRQIMARLGIPSWHTLWNHMLKGSIDQELKDWMIKYRNERGWDGASEQRECYATYFRLLHPEEEPEEYRQETVP